MARESLTLQELRALYADLSALGCGQISIPAFLRAVEARLEDGDIRNAVQPPQESWKPVRLLRELVQYEDGSIKAEILPQLDSLPSWKVTRYEPADEGDYEGE